MSGTLAAFYQPPYPVGIGKLVWRGQSFMSNPVKGYALAWAVGAITAPTEAAPEEAEPSPPPKRSHHKKEEEGHGEEGSRAHRRKS